MVSPLPGKIIKSQLIANCLAVEVAGEPEMHFADSRQDKISFLRHQTGTIGRKHRRPCRSGNERHETILPTIPHVRAFAFPAKAYSRRSTVVR